MKLGENVKGGYDGVFTNIDANYNSFYIGYENNEHHLLNYT